MTMTSSDTSDSEAARILIDRQLLDTVRTAIPGVVVAVSPDGTTVDVQPAVNMAQTLDGKTRGIPMPVLTGVPLHVAGSAALGLFVCVPVQPGDDGILIVSDRALDNWQHGTGVSMAPLAPSPRHHDLIDAMFVPGLQRAGGAIPGFPTDAVHVRNRAGTVAVEVSAAAVVLRAPLVTVEGNLLVTGSVTDGFGIVLGTHTHPGVEPGGGITGVPL